MQPFKTMNKLLGVGSRQTFLKRLLTLLLVAILLASCTPPSQSPRLLSWTYADLRSVNLPSQEDDSLQLVAMYVRLVKMELQIRLDLLTYETSDPLDIYLALDTNPGGVRDLPFGGQAGFDWDTLIHLPASGRILISDAQGKPLTNLKLRIARDPTYDDVVISLDASGLPRGLAGLSLQAFAVRSGEQKIASSIGPVQADAPPPPPAKVLFAFWDTFSAVTPAQALRRWDGAHTGPFNGRHGLRHLLGAAASDHIPIFLLDLKSAPNLSALDTVDGLPVIKSLIQQNLVYLPDTQPLSSGPAGSPFSFDDWAVSKTLEESRQAVDLYGLASNQALFSPVFFNSISDHHSLLFISEPKTDLHSAPGGRITSCLRWQNKRVISLPDTPDLIKPEDQQATQAGPSLMVMKQLLQVAAQQAGGSDSFLLLGGDLTQSAWADPAAGRPSMDYLYHHPWIQPLGLDDLLTCNPTGSYQPQSPRAPTPLIPGTPDDIQSVSLEPVTQLQEQVQAELNQAVPGTFTQATWQAYQSLLTPGLPDTTDLWILRSGYFAPTGYLLAANRWANEPVQTSDTLQMQPVDIDWDGKEEILLSSKNFLLIFKQEGGYLAAGFYRDKNGSHQIIGPSSQFYVGISDPTLWKPERGPAGDPEQMRGAFSEIPVGYISPSWEPFTTTWQPGELKFESPDGKVVKTIRVNENSFQVDYQSSDPIDVQIPLVVDPWTRNRPGWEKQYESDVTPDGWTWGIKDGLKVRISTTGALEPRAFSDSRQALLAPENPNFNYPPGHYLPFPMALGVVQGQGHFSISMTIPK